LSPTPALPGSQLYQALDAALDRQRFLERDGDRLRCFANGLMADLARTRADANGLTSCAFDGWSLCHQEGERLVQENARLRSELAEARAALARERLAADCGCRPK
jgi:hypothetical protein